MYDKIKNPITGRLVSVKSNYGKRILNKYLQQFGGKFINQGTFKCVFSPSIKCLGEDERYSGTSNPNNYISAVMTKSAAEDELKELNKILPIIDPDGNYTIQSVHKCKLGDLDAIIESKQDFEKCIGRALPHDSIYPFKNKRGDTSNDLVQLILSLIYESLRRMGSSSFEIKYLFLNFVTVLQGIKQMKDVGYIHGDIKPPNILYNINTKKYYIIDFGLSNNTSDFFSNDDFYSKNTAFYADNGYGYRYWPPCIGISEKLMNQKNQMSSSEWQRRNDTIIHDVIDTSLFSDTRRNFNADEFILESTKKFDVYSLSFLINEFLNTNTILSTLKKQNPTIDVIRLEGDLVILQGKMKQINPFDRLSIEDVIREYNIILHKYFPDEFPVHSPSPPKPGSSVPVSPASTDSLDPLSELEKELLSGDGDDILNQLEKELQPDDFEELQRQLDELSSSSPSPPVDNLSKALDLNREPSRDPHDCRGLKKGPKGKTCPPEGLACCLDKKHKKHCKWRVGHGCYPIV